MALIVVLGAVSFRSLRNKSKEVDLLVFGIAPVLDANDQVRQAIIDSSSELFGYQIFGDSKFLTSYQDARERTLSALANLQDKIAILNVRGDTKGEVDAEFVILQQEAAKKWLSQALVAGDEVGRSDKAEFLKGVNLLNTFYTASSALDEHIKVVRDEALGKAKTYSIDQMVLIVAATLLALVTALILGVRYTRSVSLPIAALHDTMTRQIRGDMDARADEKHGSAEVQTVAADFNALALANSISNRRIEDLIAYKAGLTDLSLALGQELSLEDLLTRIVEAARKIVGARYAALGLLDANGTELKQFVFAGLSLEEQVAIGELPQGVGILGAILTGSQPIRLEHLRDDPRSVGFPSHHPPMDSLLGVPIIMHKKVFGGLYLTDKVGGSFSDEDEQVATSFALQAAVAVENMRFFDAERQRVNIVQRGQAIEHAIHTVTEPQQAFNILCTTLGEEMQVHRVVVMTSDTENRPRLTAQWHLPSLALLGDLSAESLLCFDGPGEELWKSADIHVCDDISASIDQTDDRVRIFHEFTGARSSIVAPIGLSDHTIGTIYVIMVDGPRQWTDSEINLVTQAASFVGQVIALAEYRANQTEHIERLERLELQKTNFVATVSHELRTPLTSIAGYLELLKDGFAGELTDEQCGMLEVMDRNSERLRILIENLLILNQGEYGDAKSDIVGISMGELVTNTCRELSPIAQRRAVKLEIDAGPEATIVNGDQAQLQNAIGNVISNAVKFSRSGGVVKISCTTDENTRLVQFVCQDFGIGVPVTDQGSLFGRFFRASNAMKQQIPGTGLGLSIVKQIIHEQGGHVHLTSIEGEGTTVVIDLPLSTRDSA